ncbi:MAG: type II toxin-antitoxin system HicB family antitoxin [bacterium]
MLNLFINNYVEKMLKKVRYEFDKETKSWCAILKELPGVYAQADTVEEVRQQAAEVIEDYVIVSLQNSHNLPAFKKKINLKAKAYV